MIGQKRRFIFLIAIMVILVIAVSLFSSYYMYRTSLNEQKNRLSDIVQIQKNVVSEIGLRLWGGKKLNEQELVNTLVRAHSLFMEERESVEFTVAKEVGDTIRFLIVNGRSVGLNSPMSTMPLEGKLATPMKKALSRQVGTVIGADYKGREVLAAYTYAALGDQTIGLVAKVDIIDIKYPFIKANGIVLAFGTFLTILGVWLFFKISDPILRDIHESEENYRGLVESANSIILRIDSNYSIVFANKFATEKLSINDKELLGTSILELFEDKFNIDSLHELAEVLKERTGLKPTQMRTTKPEAGWVSWRVRLVEGQTDELLCIGTDVSNEHIAREAQKEIQERFRALAKAAPVGIIITEIKGNLIYANETMHALTKASTAELAGKGWLNFIETSVGEQLQENWFVDKNYDAKNEFQLSNKDGQKSWVLGQAVPLKNAHGVEVGSLLTLTDITRIKEAEIAQSRLTAAIEQAAEMIIITDVHGSIQYVNPTFVTTSGYGKEEAVGQNPRILKSGDQSTEFYEELWSILTSGETWSGRFINKRKDGERYTQESTIAPIRNTQGECIGYVGVARDITEQLFMETRLRQSQKLESIGELAAGIAHEINTPTQYVASNLQFFEDAFKTYAKMTEGYFQLADYIADKDFGEHSDELAKLAGLAGDRKEVGYLNEDLPEALKETDSGLKRISEIVQSIKQLAHPGEVTKGYWDLNEIVKDAMTVSTNEWKYCAEIKLELDKELPQVFCLKAEIGQVVLNLIVNAAHAIEEAREAPSEQGTITLHTEKKDEFALFAVTDTGTGIPEEMIERIFDPFFTTKEVGKGTGQGLAIAHNVVTNLHEGSLEVMSTPGEGTTFTIMLPFDEKDYPTSS